MNVWPTATEVVNAVWASASSRRWCPHSPPEVSHWFQRDEHATLIVEVAGRLVHLPLTLCGDVNSVEPIGRLTDGRPIFDGTQSRSYVEALLGQAKPCAAYSGTMLSLNERFSPLAGEQSNSSVQLDKTVLKFFRTPVIGENPEVTLSNALWKAGFTNIPAPIAYFEYNLNGIEMTLAYAAEFIPNVVDGFKWFCQNSHDTDSADSLIALGSITRNMHKALAESLGITAISINPTMRLQSQINEIRIYLDKYLQDQLDEALNHLNSILITGIGQRIHGDYHLGQCLKTDRWYILDFEGEPLRSLTQRTEFDLVERDVAGLLRSLDYARAVGNHSHKWCEYARNAYLDGYGSLNTISLAFFELEKAIYEVKYEAEMRPTWIPIPIAGIQRAIKSLYRE